MTLDFLSKPLRLCLLALRDNLLEERQRWVLWLPVGIGTGVAIYFQLPFELPLWPFATVAAVALVAAILGRNRTWILVVGLTLFALTAGVAVAKWRVAQVAGPILARDLGPVSVEGRLLEAEPLPNGTRLTLDELNFERVNRSDLPRRVRVVSRQGAGGAEVGDRVRMTVQLSGPSGPAAPGAYDFQRDAWFLQSWIDRLRQRITQRLLAIGDTTDQGKAEGGMAASLITGEQNALPREVLQAMRDSGLAHILSVSGLHLAIVAAFLMLVIRSLLAAIQPIALRYPIKKWAAGIALLGTFFYLLLAGAPVPAQRSFVMAAIVLLAIVADRSVLSMRTVAWAALAVIVLAPESVLGASFQMSFAAVIALIAAWEAVRPYIQRWRENRISRLPRWLEWLGGHIGGVLLTTLVAGLASSGFGLYHFNRVALFSIAANLLAVPITGFLVMPFGMLALALMPFGLEGLALEPMRWGIAAIIYIAREVASWPGAAALLPALPPIALPLIAIGGLWLCLWQRRWRLLGLVPLAAVALLAVFARTPDIMVSSDARLFAVRDRSTGHLMLSAPRRNRLIGETWVRRLGDDETAEWPRNGSSVDGSLTCDPAGCILRRDGHLIALVERGEALTEDCATAELVISQVFARGACRNGKAVLIDVLDMHRDGSYVLFLGDKSIEKHSVREDRGDRPWTRY